MEGESSDDSDIFQSPHRKPTDGDHDAPKQYDSKLEEDEKLSDSEMIYEKPHRGSKPYINVTNTRDQVGEPGADIPVAPSDTSPNRRKVEGEAETSPISRGEQERNIGFLSAQPARKNEFVENKEEKQPPQEERKYDLHARKESSSLISIPKSKMVKQDKRAEMWASNKPEKKVNKAIEVSSDREDGSLIRRNSEVSEKLNNKTVWAFVGMFTLHACCTIIFAANTFFLPLYYLKDSETEKQIGEITFQHVEIYCGTGECNESFDLDSKSYLDICGIDDEDGGSTTGFITDYTLAASLSTMALYMSGGNFVLWLIILFFLLGKKISNCISQVFIALSGVVSLGEFFVGLVVPLQTQLGTWNRDKVVGIFQDASFACDRDVNVFSSYGFLTVWAVLAFTIADMAVTQRLFMLTRMLASTY